MATKSIKLRSFSDALAMDVAQFGVKVCTLEPGDDSRGSGRLPSDAEGSGSY